MKKTVTTISSGIIFCLLAALPAAATAADNIFRIEVGSSSDISKSELERRVYALERAVLQLQQKVFALEAGADAPRVQYSTCYIKTPFNGTISSTAPTETAARAGALEKCSKAGVSSIYCEEDSVKCGK